MLDKVFVRTHSTFGADALDVGVLAEACLFYGTTELVLSRSSLRQLLDLYGADSVVRFVSDGYVRAHLLDLNVGISTEEVGTPSERHRPVTFKIHDSIEGQVIKQFREATGRSGYGRKRAMSFLDAVHPIDLHSDWGDSVIATFSDLAFLSKAVAITARHAAPHADIGEVTVRDLTDLGDGTFRLVLSENWSDLQAAYAASHGTDTISQAHLLVYLADILTDLQLASRLQGEISTSDLGADLLQLKCRELQLAATLNRSAVSEFQSHVLRGRDLRSSMNSGGRSLDELMVLLDRSRKFRAWIDHKPIESDLVADYIDEATGGTWASALPAKLFRLAVTVGAPLLAPGVAAGLAAGATLSIVDSLVVDRLVKGWTPNQFVDHDLKPFVSIEE